MPKKFKRVKKIDLSKLEKGLEKIKKSGRSNPLRKEVNPEELETGLAKLTGGKGFGDANNLVNQTISDYGQGNYSGEKQTGSPRKTSYKRYSKD